MSFKKTIQLFGVAIVVAFTGSSGWACEAAPTNAWLKPLTVGPDCSFENAGRGRWGHGRGAAVVNIGGGRIGQKITFGHFGCSASQVLLFKNCNVDAGIVLVGKFGHGPQIAGGSFTSIEAIQAPDGPIGLTKNSTVGELQEIAIDNDIRFSTDLKDFFQENAKMKRFDYSCGCELYYPDSPGAKS